MSPQLPTTPKLTGPPSTWPRVTIHPTAIEKSETQTGGTGGTTADTPGVPGSVQDTLSAVAAVVAQTAPTLLASAQQQRRAMLRAAAR
jgi:hypothetical protein